MELDLKSKKSIDEEINKVMLKILKTYFKRKFIFRKRQLKLVMEKEDMDNLIHTGHNDGKRKKGEMGPPT